jgi:hypothetical protein
MARFADNLPAKQSVEEKREVQLVLVKGSDKPVGTYSVQV